MTGLWSASLAAMFLSAQPAGTPQSRIEQNARIVERMREMHVPAISIALIESGKISWTKTYGPVNAETLFQAASISKPVAATGALHMMQYGNFTLDEDVNGKLKSWKVPDNGFTSARKVTLRGILSHTAGLTVHGFPGYAAGHPTPTLVQVLKGEKPANTAPVVVDIEPGAKWRYSGGGYTVLQQLMADRANMPFPALMQRMVLGRIGMKRSTYEQPLPPQFAANAAVAADDSGKPLPGKWHVYPEMAAAGLWATPSDLARWAIEIREAYHGRSNKVIERATAREMLTPRMNNWGLGPRVTGTGAALAFMHGGSNAGFKCFAGLLVESGHGLVVMTNAENGESLMHDIVKAAIGVYQWPGAWSE